jgi:hypothetical protein
MPGTLAWKLNLVGRAQAGNRAKTLPSENPRQSSAHQNTKSEARNTKQIRNSKNPMTKTRRCAAERF